MIKEFKKIFTINTILNCYISAIGYGLGYAIPDYYGLNLFVCIISCIILGTIFDFISKKILNSKAFNYSTKRKVLLTIVLYAFYFIVCLSSVKYLNHDIDYDFFISLGFIVLFQIVSFTIKYFKSKQKKELI